MNGLLSLLIFLPVAGALAVFFVPREKPRRSSAGSRRSSRAPSSSSPSRSGLRGASARPGDFFFRETLDWIPSLGAKYALGVDGIAALLILLTTLLSFISVYSSLHGRHEAREGVLRVPPPPRDGDGRRLLRARLLPLLRLLGSHARPDVLPDRRSGAGRGSSTPRSSSSSTRSSARSSCCSRSSPSTSSTRSGFLWWKGLGNAPTFDIVHFHAIASQIPPRPPDLALLGLLPRLRDQGPDVPVPHVAAGRPRRGARRPAPSSSRASS